MKEEITDALKHICKIKDAYINPIEDYKPPYTKRVFYLDKYHLENLDTNNLSQIIFIEHYGTAICISGDIEESGWKKLLEVEPSLKDWLKKTNIFIASHHGRKNGYCSDIFLHCTPECIIISDKGIIHDTQRNMCSIYGNCISGNGVIFNGDVIQKRRVLTTRDDGHIWVQLQPNKKRIYRNFKHE